VCNSNSFRHRLVIVASIEVSFRHFTITLLGVILNRKAVNARLHKLSVWFRDFFLFTNSSKSLLTAK